jgi:hypothetical protein
MEESLDLDIDDRKLCPEGSCIGVLDDQGICKVCGRTESGQVVAYRAASSPTTASVDATPAAEDWDDRSLCPDDSCIGVLGADRRCPVCGRSS